MKRWIIIALILVVGFSTGVGIGFASGSKIDENKATQSISKAEKIKSDSHNDSLNEDANEDDENMENDENPVVKENNVNEGKAGTVSELLRSGDRLWLFVPGGMDKSNKVTAVYLTRPDGTLRYCVNPSGVGTLGELSRMSDDEIVALMDSTIQATSISSYASDEGNSLLLDYIRANNLRYWVSIFTDATGNYFENERIIFEGYPYPVNLGVEPDERKIYGFEFYYGDRAALGVEDPAEPPAVAEYAADRGYFEFNRVEKGEIYDSKYVVLPVMNSDYDECCLITRYKGGKEFDVNVDTIESEDILVDKERPDNYERKVIYRENV